MRRQDLGRTALGLACAGLLLATAPVFAQSGNSSSFGSSGGFNSTSIGGGSSSSGGSGGSSFLTGTSGSGGSSFLTGTSGTSGMSGTNGGRSGGTTQVGSTSFLGSSYANPIAMGLSSGSGTTTTNTAFGTALYNLNTNTNRSGTATVSSSSQNSQSGAGYNIRRLPAYATTLKIRDLPPPPTATQVQSDLQAMLAQTLTQSSDLDRRDSVRVVIDGQAVVLRGQVADDDERRLVENMVKLTPGVNQVRNELTMMPTTTASRTP